MIMTLQKKAAALGAAAGVALCVLAAPAQADESWLADVTDSADLTGPVVHTGSVMNGSSAAVGAMVEMRAWPSTAFSPTAEIGDSYDLLVVAKAVTDSNGQYELRIEDTSQLLPQPALPVPNGGKSAVPAGGSRPLVSW